MAGAAEDSITRRRVATINPIINTPPKENTKTATLAPEVSGKISPNPIVKKKQYNNTMLNHNLYHLSTIPW